MKTELPAPGGERRAGFTLVEILIAIGLLGLVVAAIYSSWTAILRATKVGQDAAVAAQRARITIRTLEDSLGSAQSFDLAQRYYGFVVENGSEASLSFVCRLAKSFPRGGKFGDLDVRRVTFSVEKGGESAELVLRQNPLLMDPDQDEQDHPLLLAKNVKEFKIELWDAKLNDWVDEWKQTNQLPKCVKLTLKLAGNSRGEAVEEITRIISLPAVAVARGWQGQGPGGPGGQPPQQGNVFQPNPNQNPYPNPNQNPNQNPYQNPNQNPFQNPNQNPNPFPQPR